MNKVLKPLITPAADKATKIGWKIPEITSIKALKIPCFSTFSSELSESVVSVIPKTWLTSSKTCVTWLPITTWYCPPAFITVTTPSILFRISSFAIDSSFNLKRKRVMQCFKETMFSFPPTLVTISFAKLVYFPIIKSSIWI